MKIDPLAILAARILIVDDQHANLSLLERLLDEAGYTQVATTTASHEVCAMHRAQPFDLILLDLHMPGMDGFEVMAGLKAADADASVPVIVLTAQPAHKLRALQAGARDFLSKPFDLVEVKTRIRNMLEVRLLHQQLAQHNQLLEQTVLDRTADLRASEQRFRRLTALASDWYWEQNETGDFTQVSGPVPEMLGLRMASFLGQPADGAQLGHNGARPAAQHGGWIESERAAFQAHIAARQPFSNFGFSRLNADGTRQHYRVSGEPIFNQANCYTGYRGIGAQITLAGPPELAAAHTAQ